MLFSTKNEVAGDLLIPHCSEDAHNTGYTLH